MRLMQPGLSKDEKKRATNFASWLLEIGDGKIGTVEEKSEGDSSWITIPKEFCIPNDDNGLRNLIGFIYDKNTLQRPTAGDLQQKAIVYTSSDEAIPVGSDRGEVELLYPPEYLNTLQFLGFPPHQLELKVGAPIMLLRNMNLQGGMCNGTRMIIQKLWSILIEAQVITGNRVDNMTANCISDLKPGAKNKILEAKGNAIQANMGTGDIPYFESLLKEGPTYRITGFVCIAASKYQQTVDTETALKFGSGDVVDLTRWDNMAIDFSRGEFEKMEQPVVFAVSSYIQLSGTPATHYYFNPDIPGLEELRDQYRQRLILNPPLQISKEKYSDINAEQNRNRFPLSTLL
ncbi:DNA helicase [Tanacetum coccineum]